MISGSLSPTHGSSNFHVIQVTAPDNDVVNEVPVVVPGMYLGRHVHVTELEEGDCESDPIQSRQNSRRPLLFMLPKP